MNQMTCGMAQNPIGIELRKSEKKILFTGLAFVLLNFVLKILFISNNSIAGDEPFTIYHAQMDVPSLLHYLKNYNNPPLYELILHYWIHIFGIGSLSVRFLPL